MKPILFNTEMVRAILDGRKTVTRRVVKRAAVDNVLSSPARKENPDAEDSRFIRCLCTAPCEPGDILYVRETWCSAYDGEAYFYLADKHTEREESRLLDYDDVRWHPSIHMPKEAARLFLRVSGVRVERLQDSFTEQGDTITALRDEGVDIGDHCRQCIENYGNPCCNDLDPDLEPDDNGEDENGGSECGMLDEVRSDFARLWDNTLKPADRALYGWDANPWVWVIEFERISKEEALGGGGDAN